ncbi:CaiB/BaiF CoA transferase family protein [Roseinatronobacter alkalisoli]|uniref:CoA transferase n=1 Tax=Roseinatronobacter alkalisoli TaxID=3028235 RepID=A0ABT5TCI6_9RHOB|nr:CoA transferase [Roseinatronobacter sp. HJB301]MDD7972711.1 CoA transferase [Roseinatronobacter sp. HJB301]
MTALQGMKVLDFSRLLPGPYCTWLLADMGADVIRIENPRELKKQAKVFGWDRLTPTGRAELRQNDILSRNKKSLKLDIGNPDALALIKRLVLGADIMVEDYRPGVLASLGLDYQTLQKINPRLIYCSLTLCGHTGPYRDKPGHDPVALAISGALSRIGENADTPSFAGVPVADIVTGTHAAFGILAAAIARQRDGKGQHVDIAMSDCAMSLLVNVLSRHPDPSTIPPRGARRADMGLWRTKDNKFIVTTDMEPRYWHRFCEAVGKPEFTELQHDVQSWPRIRTELQIIFSERTRDEWLDLLTAAQTQFCAVHDVAEALTDEHNLARGMVVPVQSDTGRDLQQIGSPVKLTRTPARVRNLAPVPGQDRDEILFAAGLGAKDIKALAAAGAFGEDL